MMRHDEFEHEMSAEAPFWPGVTYSFGVGGKHGFCNLCFAGITRKVVHSLSPGDGNASKQFMRDVRRILTSMGAIRDEPAPRSGHKSRPHTERHIAAPKPPKRPPNAEERDDPWHGPLMALRNRMEPTE